MAHKYTCLLIDDDTDDQEIFVYALKQLDKDIECLVFDDGKQAISSLKQAALLPDYIFLDLNMPGMDGKQCLKEIKKIDRLEQIPVIIYSTSSNQRDKDETKDLGAGDYIEKQPSLPLLVQKLGHFF